MAGLYDMVFLLQFLLVVGLFFVKVYNVMHKGEKFDIVWIILSIVLFMVVFGVGFVIMLLDFDNYLYMMLFRLEVGLFIFGFMMGIVEIILWLAKTGNRKVVPYTPGG